MGKAESKPAPQPVRYTGLHIQAVRNGYVVREMGPWLSRRDEYCVIEEGREWVFADFASLTAWMKQNLKHGCGVE